MKVLADSYRRKKLNSPNDVWIVPLGSTYFTDSRYGDQDDLQHGGFQVYYKANNGGIVRLIDHLVKPNSIIGRIMESNCM